MFGKKKKGENEEQKPETGQKTLEVGKKPKVSKGFGNTIILFIVFFIVFTVIVTGVAFFADRVDFGGNKAKNLEELEPKEKMTDPGKGESTEYVMDEKGNVGKKEEAEQKQPEPVKPAEKKAEELQIPAAKPENAPLPPVNIKPEIKPAPKPAPKPAVKPAAKPAPTATLGTKVTTGDYVVQLASFKHKEYADAEMRKLKRLLPDVFVVQADLGEKGVWYRLRCFNGVTREEAVAKAAEIKKRTKHDAYPMKK